MTKKLINLSKYKQLLLLILSKLNNKLEGNKKFWKILYFLDFDMFEYSDKTLTDDTYAKWNMGPKPVNLDVKLIALQKEGFIDIESKNIYGTGYKDTKIYKLKKPLNDKEIKYLESVFNKKEKFIIERNIKLYGNKNGKELELLSQQEAPYNAVELYQIMDYELSYYRDTQF
jgi:uncharacterized phage-associated protein